MNGIILPIAITLVVYITTRQLDDPATTCSAHIMHSLLTQAVSGLWSGLIVLPPESLPTDLLRPWLLPTGDLHKPRSLCRRHHRVLAQTSCVFSR